MATWCRHSTRCLFHRLRTTNPLNTPVGAPLVGALSRQYAPPSPPHSPPPHGHPLWVPFPATPRRHHHPPTPLVGAPLVGALSRQYAPPSPPHSPPPHGHPLCVPPPATTRRHRHPTHHPRMDTPCACPFPPIRAAITTVRAPLVGTQCPPHLTAAASAGESSPPDPCHPKMRATPLH